MLAKLFKKFEHEVALARKDEFYSMPPFVRAHGKAFLSRHRFIVFSDSYDVMASEICRLLAPYGLLGVCSDKQPPGCDGVPFLAAFEVYELARKFTNIVAVMVSDESGIDFFLNKIALTAKLPLLSHHLVIRLAKATVDLRVGDWLASIVDRANEFKELIDSLDDEFSKVTTLSVLLTQLTGNHVFRRAVERPYNTLYFNSGLFDLSDHEVFVDCGASVGESIQNLLRETGMRLDRSFEIEPDRHNVVKLQQVKDQLGRFGLRDRIEIVPLAVGDCEGIVPFVHRGNHGSSIDPNSSDRVEITTVDIITGGQATLIKMDLEGYERQALAGAEATITKSHPKIAISAYHRPDDLIELARLIRKIHSDYKVGVQHHTSLRWDTCLYFY